MILYWILISKPLDIVPAVIEISVKSEVLAEEFSLVDQVRNSEGFDLGCQFLEGVKEAACRSLFSLFLAGLLVITGLEVLAVSRIKYPGPI